MNTFTKYAMVATLTLASAITFAASSAPVYGVIDMEKIASHSKELKAAAAKLKKQFAPMQASLQKKSMAFQKNMQNLQKNQATMKPADLAALRKTVQTEQMQLQLAQSKLQQQAMTSQQATMKTFLSEVKKASARVASKKGYSIVFPTSAVVFYNKSYDITSDVLAKLDD